MARKPQPIKLVITKRPFEPSPKHDETARRVVATIVRLVMELDEKENLAKKPFDTFDTEQTSHI